MGETEVSLRGCPSNSVERQGWREERCSGKLLRGPLRGNWSFPFRGPKANSGAVAPVERYNSRLNASYYHCDYLTKAVCMAMGVLINSSTLDHIPILNAIIAIVYIATVVTMSV